MTEAPLSSPSCTAPTAASGRHPITCSCASSCRKDREPDRPANHVLPPSTDAAEAFSLATRWLENCLEKHEECREREDARREGVYFPKRLLDVSALDHLHLLLCSANEPPTGPYFDKE